jgi:uncharacterized protein
MAEAQPAVQLAAPATSGPTTRSERIASLDVLRGFALMGILIVNVQSFSMIQAAFVNPTAYGDLTGANYAVWLTTFTLFDQKFMTIFSMLFGAGVVLFTERLERTGRPAAKMYYRRTLWLLVFGLLHAHLLWYGDVLFYYGVCGLIVFLFRGLSPRWLIVWGLLSIGVASVLSLLAGLSMPFWSEADLADLASGWRPSAEAIARELSIYRGGWLEQMAHRSPTALEFEILLFPAWGLWRAGGLMLLGMALFKQEVFAAARSFRFYATLIALGLLVGLPMVLGGVLWNTSNAWPTGTSMFFGGQFNYWGSIPVSLGYVGGVMLLCRSGMLPGLQRALAAVGQTALTNYLAQTVICTWIFYGHGLGLFGSVSRVDQFAIVVAVSVLQLAVSPLWLRFFRFGPCEWAWRALTYRQLPPIRR